MADVILPPPVAPAGGTVPPGVNPGDNLEWNGAAWVPTEPVTEHATAGFVTIAASTTSTTFVPVPNSVVTVPSTGTWAIFFEGETDESGGALTCEIELRRSTGGPFSTLGNLTRRQVTYGGAGRVMHGTSFVTALNAGDQVQVYFRRSGPAGTVRIVRRRLIILKVS